MHNLKAGFMCSVKQISERPALLALHISIATESITKTSVKSEKLSLNKILIS